MISEKIMRKYAELAVTMGANVQKGQTLIIQSSVDAKEMVRYCVEAAYQRGAGKVSVIWNDPFINRMDYEYQSEESLSEVPSYEIDRRLVPFKEGACILNLHSDVPGLMAGIDAEKMQKAMVAKQKANMECSNMMMSNQVRWSILGVPNEHWASKVFPGVSKEEALEKLWNAVLKTVRIDEDNDPVAKWEEHINHLKVRQDILNERNYKTLHFTNQAGTDLYVDLVENHIWCGWSEEGNDGVVFNENMPTEEIFTMPSKYGVNGVVVSTKPLNYNGTLIDRFSLTFKDGKVVSYHADNEEEALKSLIEFDEGSCYIGEVALVPYESPISQSQILFYNTLYDENASCHLALGRAYPLNLKNGTSMSQEELEKAGCNQSMTHVDFMFGSEDMTIVGITHDGKEEAIFESGNFVF